jgi:hypothetical protein
VWLADVQREHVEVDVEVQARTESLDGGHEARLAARLLPRVGLEPTHDDGGRALDAYADGLNVLAGDFYEDTTLLEAARAANEAKARAR